MKTPAIWLCATVLLAPAMACGAPFEGRVHMQRAEIPGDPHSIIYSVKGDKVRVEVVRERVQSYITDTAKKETTVIMEDDMAYLILPSLAAQADDGPKLEKTGETATILGYSAQKYVFDSDEGKTELWLVEGFGKYTGFGEGFEQPPPQVPNVDLPDPVLPWAWEYALAGEPLFPLRVVTRDTGGQEIFRLEARAITPQALPDGLFAPSVNYKKLTTWPEQ